MEDVPLVRRQVLHPGGGAVRTKQADLKASDINGIVSRWLKTGVPPEGSGVARYGDFRNADDYLSCLLRVQEAEREFLKLPALVRRHVDNDPGKFLEMVFDPDRRPELEELGLVEAQVPPPVEPPAGAPEGPETPDVPA